MNVTLRVLYAEDNAMDAELTRMHFFEHAPDIAIELVETGQGCLDRLAQADCDLLLLDHHLPDMEGLEVLKTLIHTNQNIPVVLVTGVGDETLVVKALRLGAASYVPKLGNYLATLPDLLRLVIEDHRLKKTRGLLTSASRRILYVEHHSMDIELTLHHFAEAAPQFQIDVVRTCADALACLARSPAYDVALIDLRMPDQSGLDFAREAQRRHLPLPPFIMISGKGDEEVAIASLKLGAADYVPKREGYLEQLQYAIDRAIAHARLDRISRQLQDELVERKRIENQILDQRATLNAILESSDCPIFSVDRGYRYTAFNRAHAAMMKALYGVDIQLGRSLADYQTVPDDWQVAQKNLDRALRGETLLESAFSGDEGHSRQYLEIAHYPVRTDAGEIIGVSVFARDVTARKRADDEREKLKEQLRIAQKMEAIGVLAGGVAHDFNNLLSVILGQAELVLEGEQDSVSYRNALLEVKSAGERAAELTRQLLAFSRKQVLQPVSLNLNQIAMGLDKMLRRIVGEDIDYVLVLAPDLGLTWADPGQIEQVIMNLVVNARDAMPEGGKLTIETSNVDVDEGNAANTIDVKPGPYVHLAVTETGCGMDEVTRVRIFEPFFTTKGIGKGTGLGLSTVYGIVKQSDGNIWVTSEVGHGATFSISLPRVTSPISSPTVKAVVTRVMGTETILVVEDEEAIGGIVKQILNAAGYTVLTAATSDEALRICTLHPSKIHLLLTDVVMPKMGGRGVAEHVVRIRPGIKVLYMSGYTDDAIVHHGTLAPGTHFIAKPFSAETLTSKVREVLDQATRS